MRQRTAYPLIAAAVREYFGLSKDFLMVMIQGDQTLFKKTLDGSTPYVEE
jgi:hypothetical protein